jgi:hypothetical protein
MADRGLAGSLTDAGLSDAGGENGREVVVSVGSLSKGLYLCRVIMDGTARTATFIKKIKFMKRINRLVMTLVMVVAVTGLVQASKSLSVYKDGFVTVRVPVAEIDSMNFSEDVTTLTLDDYLELPKTVADMLVDVDYFNTDAHDVTGFMAVLLATDLMGEDMLMSESHWFDYDYCHDNRLYNYRRTKIMWLTFMEVVKLANRAIETAPDGLMAAYLAGTTNNVEPTPAVKTLGQAYALRAFAYYYLVQLYQFTAYQDVPANLSLPTVPLLYASNEPLYGQRNAAMPASVVLKQVEDDLLLARKLVGINRLSKDEINRSVVNGLLARYYLLTGAWDKAYLAATDALSDFSIMPAEELEDGFMNIYNQEWMWGYTFKEETNSYYASYFSHISNLAPGYAGLGYNPKKIDARLYGQISSTDARRRWFQSLNSDIDASGRADASATGWQQPYANLKFGWQKGWSMDYCYMRAAEMVLIQAESLVRQGKQAEAATALAVLMAQRDPSWEATSVTLDAVLLQRRIELWGEGFVYFDLKRTNKGIDRSYDSTNHVLTPDLVVPANDERWYYQLPEVAFTEFPALNVVDKLPQLKPITPVAVSGTQVAFSFELDPYDASVSSQKGIQYSLDPAFEKGKTKFYSSKMVGGRLQDTLLNLKPNTTYYAQYFYSSAYGVVYSTLFSFVTPSVILPSVSIGLDSLWVSGFSVAATCRFEGASIPVLSQGFELAFDDSFMPVAKRVTVDASNFSKRFSTVYGDTVYFVRAFASTADGKVCSKPLAVSTLPNNGASVLSQFVGTYSMRDYSEGGIMEAAYEVELSEKPNDPTCLLLRNFWDGECVIEIGFNLVDRTVFIDNSQVIYNHSTYGPVRAIPIVNGVRNDDIPLMGVIESDGSITLSSWAAIVEIGSFGTIAYSTLRQITATNAPVVPVNSAPRLRNSAVCTSGSSVHGGVPLTWVSNPAARAIGPKLDAVVPREVIQP